MPKTRGNKSINMKRKMDQMEVELAKPKRPSKKIKLDIAIPTTAAATSVSSAKSTPSPSSLRIDSPTFRFGNTPPPFLPRLGYFGDLPTPPVDVEAPIQFDNEGFGGLVPFIIPIVGTKLKAKVFRDDTGNRTVQIREYDGDIPTGKYIHMWASQYMLLKDFLKYSKEDVMATIRMGANANYKFNSHLGRGLFLQAGFPYWTINVRHFYRKNVQGTEEEDEGYVSDEGYSNLKSYPTKQGINIKFKHIDELCRVLAVIDGKYQDLKEGIPCFVQHNNQVDFFQCDECNWNNPQ